MSCSRVPCSRIQVFLMADVLYFNLLIWQNLLDHPSQSSLLSQNLSGFLRKILELPLVWLVQRKGTPSQHLGNTDTKKTFPYHSVSSSRASSSSKPKFSTLSDTFSYKAVVGSAFTLLCPAQGSPIPSYRYILPRFSKHLSRHCGEHFLGSCTQKLPDWRGEMLLSWVTLKFFNCFNLLIRLTYSIFWDFKILHKRTLESQRPPPIPAV